MFSRILSYFPNQIFFKDSTSVEINNRVLTLKESKSIKQEVNLAVYRGLDKSGTPKSVGEEKVLAIQMRGLSSDPQHTCRSQSWPWASISSGAEQEAGYMQMDPQSLLATHINQNKSPDSIEDWISKYKVESN